MLLIFFLRNEPKPSMVPGESISIAITPHLSVGLVFLEALIHSQHIPGAFLREMRSERVAVQNDNLLKSLPQVQQLKEMGRCT